MASAGIKANPPTELQQELSRQRETLNQLVKYMKSVESRLVSMQPAGAADGSQLAELQEELSRQHEAQGRMAEFLASVDSRLNSLQSAVSSKPADPVRAAALLSPSRLASPPVFRGDPHLCRGFLNQCSLHFELTPLQQATDRSKIAFIMSHLSEQALAWMNPLWERNDPTVQVLSVFLNTFRKVFDEPGRLPSTASALLRIRQGKLSVGQYAIEFRTLSSELEWNNNALVAAFWEGLSGRIKDELAGRDVPTTLEELISLATRIDLRFQERDREVTRERGTPRPAPAFPRSVSPPATRAPVRSEPMEIDRVSDSRLRQENRRRAGECFYCGSTKHLILDCPVKPGNSRT